MGGERFFLGANCSRTRVRIGVAKRDGVLREMADYPLEACTGAAVVHRLQEAVAAYCQARGGLNVEAVGVGLPGYINPSQGVWMRSLDLGVDTALPVAMPLSQQMGVPVYIDNDINAAALAELYFGMGRICEDFLYLGLGDGVAMGIVADGRLIRGIANCAGEIGHMSVETGGRRCECGYQGCLEGIASVNALLRETRLLLSRYPASPLVGLEREGKLTAEEILRCAEQGEELARKVGMRVVRAVGTGVVNSMNLLNPGYIILSGPLIYNSGRGASSGSVTRMTRWTFTPTSPKTLLTATSISWWKASRCKTFLENMNRKQALAFGLMAKGGRFFYILWKFCGVDFQNRIFVSKQVELHSSFEN